MFYDLLRQTKPNQSIRLAETINQAVLRTFYYISKQVKKWIARTNLAPDRAGNKM